MSETAAAVTDQSIISSISLRDELNHRKSNQYSIRTDISAELGRASRIYLQIQQEMVRLSHRFTTGRNLDIRPLSALCEQLVDSVINNPASAVWLARLKSKSSYGIRHRIAAGILCAVMGRQLGLAPGELLELCLVGLLQDVGMLQIPDDLLRKQGTLSPQEVSEIRSHVGKSLKVLKHSGLSQSVFEGIRSHHERFDGSGYPDGLTGSQIPLYARIAGIVDCYDAMISPRHYATPLPHADALLKISRWRKTLFQKELIDTFVQAIGLYPPGSLVELSSGEVAVITDYEDGNSRKPQLRVILDEKKQRLTRGRVLSLTEHEGDTIIAKALPPGAYDLDPEAIL